MQETCLNLDSVFYTTATNNIISKNMALESLLLRMIDNSHEDAGENKAPLDNEVLEAVLSLLLDQGNEIGGFRSACEKGGQFASELRRLTSKNFGASAITERLLNEGDKSGDLLESLVSLIQSQFADIQEIRGTLAES